MTEVAKEQPQQAMGLEEALEVLNCGRVETEEQLQALLRAIQQACTGLVQLVEGGAHLQVDLLENALEAVSRGLGTARQHIEQAAGQLQAVQRLPWSEALLAAADTCLHNERWHAAWHADAAAGGTDAYKRAAVLARDMLNTGLLPMLCEATAQQTAASGFCLAPQYRALLAMGRTAAEVVGMRDPRHRLPGLRNFSVLNVLWNGIQRLWASVPAEARQDMEKQGLGGGVVVGPLLSCLRKDVRCCHRLLDPGLGKLLQYWLQKANGVLCSYPAAVPGCWGALLEAVLCSYQELTVLQELHDSAEAEVEGSGKWVAALAEALHGQVIPKAVRLLAHCLGWTTSEDQLRVMLDMLRMQLSAGEPAGQQQQPVHALRTALQLLQASPSLPPLARHQCTALLGSVLDALPGAACAAALQSAELREGVAESLLVFMAACCHMASTAASNDSLQAWERQAAQETWERCQMLLFLHALHPHPLTTHLLGRVWGDVVAAADERLLKAHVTALHDLLRLVAAAEATGPYTAPSPLHMHLLSILASLLSTAPATTLDAYFANFLQLLPGDKEDSCRLACLAAELRLATLVDTARGGPCAAWGQVQLALRGLIKQLHEEGRAVCRRLASSGAPGGPPIEQHQHLARLLDAVHCAAVYAVNTGSLQEEGGSSVLLDLCRVATRLLAHSCSRGVFDFAPPCLALLRDLHLRAGFPPEEIEALLPPLAACQQRPELAGAVAEVIPVLAHCPVPHAQLVQAALSAPPSAPLLQHVGLEAYWQYAQACPVKDNVPAALPPSMRNPETGSMLAGCATVLRQYSQRCPLADPAAGEQEAAAWPAALRQEAANAPKTLRRALEALRAQAATQQEANEEVDGAGMGQAGSGAGSGAGPLVAALQQLMQSIGQVEQAVQGGMQRGPLDASCTGMLQQCAVRLSQLLASAGTA